MELSELEKALMEAPHHPATEARLRRLLLEHEFYVLGEQPESVAHGQREVRLVHHTVEGRTYLPAYTSRERILSMVVGEPYVVVGGGAVFAAVQPDMRLVVNLGSWPNRTFTHEQAMDLVAEWERSRPRLRVVQPDRYPAPLLEALWAHFCRTGDVHDAHLAQVWQVDKPPRLVIGVRVCDSSLAGQVLTEARGVASGAHDAEVQLHHVGRDDLSRQVLEEGVCFFGRRLGSRPLRLVAC
jgi:hypothetical protein